MMMEGKVEMRMDIGRIVVMMKMMMPLPQSDSRTK